MDYALLFPGRFLKAAEFRGKEVTLTISDIKIEELPEDNGGTRARGIVGFKETKKALVLNRTNAECIAGMFGRETDVWIGKRVTLYPAQISSFGGSEIAVRVKGSPDIPKAKQVEIRLPLKRPIAVTMQKTATGATSHQAEGPTPSPSHFETQPGGPPEAGDEGYQP